MSTNAARSGSTWQVRSGVVRVDRFVVRWVDGLVDAVRGGWSGWRLRREVTKFDKVLDPCDGLLVERFGEEQAPVMRAEMRAEYRRLFPEMPDIGGRRNPYAALLKGSGPQALAVHRVVLRHGGAAEDTGRLFHYGQRAILDRVPQVVLHWMGRHRPAGQSLKRWKQAAVRSQARNYPGDWVFEMLDGDGAFFDFGMDVTECGAVKYLHAHGADELTPYICDLDYVMAEKMGYGLGRTKTLAWGCDKCDFRISQRGDTSAPWPPRFAERTCGRPDVARPESHSAPAH
jgi:hypothetical protein